MINFRILVRGKVQGVGFRAAAERRASELGIHGWVMNQADGSVLLEAEAEEPQLNQLVEWCRRGPRLADVLEVQITPGVVQGFTDFRVKR